MIRVKFNDPDEFLTELFAEKKNVLGDVVRLSLCRKSGEVNAVLAHLGVHCSAVVRYSWSDHFDCLVELEAPVGSFIPRPPEGPELDDMRQAKTKATGLLRRLESDIAGMQLKVRAGVYE